MKAISNYSVGLFGDTKQFSQAFGAAVKPVEQLGSGIGSVAGKFLAIAGVTATVAGLTALIHGQAEAITETTRAASRLGISTENFVGLSHAATLAGLDSETFATSITKLEKKLSEANSGSATAQESFTRLGLSAADLAAKSPDAALADIADAMKKMGSASDQNRIALDLFGKSGAGMVTVLKGGSAALSDAQKDAERLGLTFNSIDGEKVTEAHHALLRVGEAFEGVARTAAITLAPAIKWVGDSFVDSFILARQAVGTAVDWMKTKWVQLSPIFQAVGGFIATTAQAIWTTLTTTWQSIWGVVQPVVESIYNVVVSRWQATYESVVGLVMATYDVVSSVFTATYEIVTTAVSAVWSGVTAVWQWGTELITGEAVSGSATIGEAFGVVIDAMNWLRDVTTTVFNVASFAIKNWRLLLEYDMTGAAYQIVKFANETQYFFTEVIPAVAVWFANNWRDIFSDVFNYTTTVFSNLAGNIVNIIKNVPGLISGSVSFSDLWTPLTDGFKSSLKELPKIADLQVGDLEKSLGDQTDDLGSQIADGLSAHMAAKAKEAKAAATNIVTSVSSALNTAVPAVKPVEIDPVVKDGEVSIGITPEIKKAKALFSGSAEALLAAYKVPTIGGSTGAAAAMSGGSYSPPTPTPLGTVNNPAAVASAQKDVSQQLVEQSKRMVELMARIDANTASLKGVSFDTADI